MFNMKTGTFVFVFIVHCLVLPERTQCVTQLFAKIPENTAVGEQVIRVQTTTLAAKEEVLCNITDGNIHGRFRVDHCVIEVARPLDFAINGKYTLTVKVAGAFEVCHVDVDVEDVEGYPPIYNDTCEMPVRSHVSKDRKQGHPAFNVDVTSEFMGKTGGIIPHRFNTKNVPNGRHPYSRTVQGYSNDDCLVGVMIAAHHPKDVRTLNGLWITNNGCLRCFHSQDPGYVLDFVLLNNGEYHCPLSKDLDFNHMSHFWRKHKYILFGSFIFQSSKTQHFFCELPQDGLSLLISRDGNDFDEILATHAELEFQPVGCPPNKYGPTCDQNCTCENGARCHGLSGACKCQPGWQGVVCDIPHSTVVITVTPSDSPHIYINGSLVLHCRYFHMEIKKMIWIFPNGTKRWLQKTQEDQVKIESIQSEHNGTYRCTVITEDGVLVNASYELRAVACPPGKMGEFCEDVCNCLHGASCDRWSGCVCPSGWTGTFCQTPCPVGTYGQDCSSECHCQNAVCDPTDGRCNCTEGWYGRDCLNPCSNGLYGWRCRYICGCKNNATCHHVDGSCKCMSPWAGQWCDVVQTGISPLLHILISLFISTLLISVVLLALHKWKRATRIGQDEGVEETQALLELRGKEEDLAQSLQPGWLNRWERSADDLTLDELIGLGTFAHVRKGYLRIDGVDTIVAVKSVRGEDRLCYRAFCREAAILIAVHEQGRAGTGASNIIKLLGVITKSRPKCILLEYAAKHDLLAFIKQQAGHDVVLPLGSLLRYAVHISHALQELRHLRIAHGDVAARNVLITEDDVAKLSDFGLAHDVYTATTYVSSAKKDEDELLPLKWMALESLESREFTCESDVWSFGVLLWEIVTYGEEPIYEHNMQLSCPKLVGILRRGIRLQKPPECPRKLYGVMMACWSEEPSTRPTPEELEHRLTECRHDIDPLFVVEKETTL
ncbi:PREDICTED: uncharacterized protein LOC109469200 [Branchiostoma belcheri]|uniref:Uncharacterized protein LOC109469200 n=1 Tax=Branchiostoma belcheri TaxID=7741 RepID=A0A6P4YWT6_BRABE|nr:PREDICTED: uncharacterized protein LOC109469200 [Branchiostoma belcheri]